MGGKYKFFRCLAYTIEILILYVLQETPNLFGAIIGVRPVLVLSAAVTIAIFEDQNLGLGFGIFSGFLMDIGYGSIIGFNAVILGVLCYFIGTIAVNLINTNFVTASLCGLITVVVIFTMQFIFLYVIPDYGSFAYAYSYHYLPLMLYAIIPMPVLYFLNKTFVTQIREKI